MSPGAASAEPDYQQREFAGVGQVAAGEGPEPACDAGDRQPGSLRRGGTPAEQPPCSPLGKYRHGAQSGAEQDDREQRRERPSLCWSFLGAGTAARAREPARAGLPMPASGSLPRTSPIRSPNDTCYAN